VESRGVRAGRQVLPHSSHRRRRSEAGFTLIELLVVISVLAILASIVVLNVAGVGGRGGMASCQTDLKSIQTAVTAYYSDHGSVYPTAGGTVPGTVDMTNLVPVYLHSTPSTTGAVQLDANGTATSANC
jgi:prepilin-type N-terminal cleavage/methylation domain-containing protein